MLLILFVGWIVMTLLTKFHKAKSRKLAPVYFWTCCVHMTLLGLSLVVPHESWDLSVVIVLPTFSHTWIECRVLLALGYSLASFASYVMGRVLHGDFTLQRTIKYAVLDAQMNLTPSHITMSVPRCTTFFFLETCYDIATRVFLQSLQFGIVGLAFLDAFVCAHHQHRQDSENSVNFWWLHERKDSLYDGHHSCLRPRVSGNVSCSTLTWCPAPKLPVAQAQIQVSVSSQCSFHNTWKRQWLSWVGFLFRWWYSRCWWWNTCWMVWFHDLFMEGLMPCLVPSSPSRLIPLSLVPEHTPTVVYPDLSSSSDEHHQFFFIAQLCRHRHAGWNAKQVCHYRASLVHSVSAIVRRCCWFGGSSITILLFSGTSLCGHCAVCVGKHVTVSRYSWYCARVWDRRSTPTTLPKWLPWLKPCLFLVLMALWFGMSSRAVLTILCMLLVCSWARSRLAHISNWHSGVNDPWFSLSANFDSPCNTCTVTVVICVMKVLTMPLHLGP